MPNMVFCQKSQVQQIIEKSKSAAAAKVTVNGKEQKS